MKKNILAIISFCIVSLSFAQKASKIEIPSNVKAAFQKQFPKATEVKWEKEEGNFEADFDLNKVDQSAVFDAQGKLLETEVDINLSEVPKAAIDYTKSHHPGKKITEMARITNDKGLISYELEIKKLDLIFDKDGNFIKEKKQGENKEDKD